MFQTPQLYRISDDAGQHVGRVKKYIDDMKTDDQSEKIRILIDLWNKMLNSRFSLCLTIEFTKINSMTLSKNL